MPFTKLGAEIWRDDVVIGLPSSGKNPPHKPDIRTWATEVEAIFAGLGATGTLVSLSADNTWTGTNVFSKNQDAVTGAAVFNFSSGTSAAAAWGVNNGTAVGNFAIGGINYNPVPLLQNRVFVNASGGSGIALLTNDAQPIVFATNSLFRGKINSTGQWVVGPTNADPQNSAIVFAVNANTAAPIQKPVGTVVNWMVQFQGADGWSTGVTIDSFGTGNTNSFSVLTLRRANNTGASPSALKSGDINGVFGGIGYAATKYSLDQWQIRQYAAQDWTDTAWGASMAFLVTPNNSTTVFEALRIDQSGFIGIGTQSPQSLLHVNKNTTQNVAPSGGYVPLLQLTGADATFPAIEIDSYGAANVAVGGLVFRTAAGTGALPTQTQANAGIGYVGAIARTNAGAYTVVNAQFQFTAAENQTASAQGQYIDVYTTPTGSTTTARAARVQASGGISIGSTTDPGIGGLLAAKSIVSIGPTSGIGYATGAGGTVTQATSKATAVTLNTVTGAITMNGAALAAATIVSFVLTDSAIAATDHIAVAHESGGTLGSYTVNGRATGAGTAAIDVRNNTAGSLSEAIVLRFSVIKSVNS